MARDRILYPGRPSVTWMVAPNIPSSGTYLVPGISMCSLIPKEKLPYSSKLLSLTLLLTASSARLRNSPASFPRNVTTAAIGSPFLTPKSLIAFFACFVVGVLLVSLSRSFFCFSGGWLVHGVVWFG